MDNNPEEDPQFKDCICSGRHNDAHIDWFYIWWENNNGPTYLDSVKFLQDVKNKR